MLCCSWCDTVEVSQDPAHSQARAIQIELLIRQFEDDEFTVISKEEVVAVMTAVKRDGGLGYVGAIGMQGLLEGRGIKLRRSLIREYVKAADQEGSIDRWLHAIERRRYHVPFPNFLWPIDGQVKHGRASFSNVPAPSSTTVGDDNWKKWINQGKILASSASAHCYQRSPLDNLTS